MNPFAEQYKSLSNSDLLWVIDNPNDYQPLAIHAAEIELSSRKLTTEELAIANSELAVRNNKKQVKIENEIASKDILKKTMISMGDIIKRPPSNRKIKVIISIILSLIFLFQAFSRVDLTKFMFTNDKAIWDFSTAFLFIPWLLIPIGLLLFWFRKKIGWIVLSVYLAYSTCYSIINLFVWIFLEYPMMKRVISQISYLPFLVFSMLFFFGMLCGICRNDIRSDYDIKRKTSFLTIGFSFVITTLLYWFRLI